MPALYGKHRQMSFSPVRHAFTIWREQTMKPRRTGKRRNLGTFKSRAAAEKHERDVQYFKRH